MLLRPWDSPGKNTGVGCRFLLQDIFPTQGSNPGLPHCRQMLYHLSHQGSSEKHLLLLYWLCQSLWLCGSQQTGKFLKNCEYQTILPASWEICVQVKKQQLELDMEQRTGSKSGKEYVKALYCHSAYWNYIQSTSCEMLGWMKHKLESDCWQKYQ